MTRKLLFASLLGALLVAFVAFPAAAQDDRMTFEEYQAELQNWQQREQDAQARISTLESEIQALRDAIDQLDSDIAMVWQSIYDMLGLTEQDLQAFADELDAVAADLSDFQQMTPEEIYQNSERLDEVEMRLDELSGHSAAMLTQYDEIGERLDGQVDSVNARMAKPKSKMYTVVRGDYLWKIAAMPDHFGDGMKWMRIYSVNRDKINDPDLIFPDQRFNIPLEVAKENYLVKRGDFLYGIAESIYNDPFKWRKLYEANRSIISDPNYIVPEMILEVPER